MFNIKRIVFILGSLVAIVSTLSSGNIKTDNNVAQCESTEELVPCTRDAIDFIPHV